MSSWHQEPKFKLKIINIYFVSAYWIYGDKIINEREAFNFSVRLTAVKKRHVG